MSRSTIFNDYEPDAGLGNGGLGRLAACYMDSLATLGYPATGYSICYEFGIFKQKIIEGWQNELPDNWLPGGEVWLHQVPDRTVEVHFGGELEETWEDGFHFVNHKIMTQYRQYRMICMFPALAERAPLSSACGAPKPGFDMEKFNNGDYVNALGRTAVAQAISQVLYPNDNHTEGKLLRLRQQYFLSPPRRLGISSPGTWQPTAPLTTSPTRWPFISMTPIHPQLSRADAPAAGRMRVQLGKGVGYYHQDLCLYQPHRYERGAGMLERVHIQNAAPRIYQIVVEINNPLYERCIRHLR